MVIFLQDDIFKFQIQFRVWKLFDLELNFVDIFPKDPINIKPGMVQIMDYCLSGDLPCTEPMMV